ncbi:MAG: phosphatidylglycerophosphatase A [Oligoflexia bacterium]|nr:phosphatidylglycerophosphatase A [Oligoflexia bacterium]
MVYWDRVKNFQTWVAVWIGTAGGAGLVPKMPGTAGSAVAVPLFWYFADWGWPYKLEILVAILLVGTWAAKVFDEAMQTGDNQCIVIDEVLGIGITTFLLTRQSTAWEWLAAFVLFRLFDIIKIAPVRQLDRWSKKKAKGGSPWYGGFGVMGDDLLAGVQGLIVMIILNEFHVFRNAL